MIARSSAPTNPHEVTRRRIAELWQRLVPQTRERLQTLDRAAAAAAKSTLSASLQKEAGDIAHKFSGSLAMFGLADGSRLAAALDEELASPLPDAGLLLELTRQLRRSIFPPPSV